MGIFHKQQTKEYLFIEGLLSVKFWEINCVLKLASVPN